MKKYNIAINILFWTLVAFLLFITALSLFYKNDKVNSILSGLRGEESSEKEKIVIREIMEVEKEVEWYYFIASGYSANDPVQGTNNITATGKEIKEGMVAVDPKVIPLGTKIEIKDMGIFIAEDTGGKIKGNRIDIYFDTKKGAKEFSRKGIWVRIIDNSYELADLFEGGRLLNK
ncbi:MAG: 3D domain-containing protein [Actinobacteria bacterium]|nr:3D domain-containing protein [Actinomycetota bacterium]